jgi:hypothetical protein
VRKLERKVPGYHMLVKADAVGSLTEEESVLEWVKVQVSESAAALNKPAEETCRGEGRDVDCPPPPRPSTARPRTASSPPSLCTSQAVVRELAGTRVTQARAMGARAVRAWAWSMAVAPKLAGEEREAAAA